MDTSRAAPRLQPVARQPAAATRALGLALVLASAVGAAHAGKAHEHGIARVDIGVEPARVVVELDSPLDNLVGFERAPRTDAERQRVEAAVAALRTGDWARVDPAAGCTLQAVVLDSPVLGLAPGGAAAPAATPATPATTSKSEHADLAARAEFSCREGARAGFVELGLFTAFSRLQRIEVQTVSPRGQMKATLRRPAGRVALAR